MHGQGTKCHRYIAENLNRLSRAHERYRQTTDRRQTDGRAIAYSEREREFTFANNTGIYSNQLIHFIRLGPNATDLQEEQYLLAYVTVYHCR